MNDGKYHSNSKANVGAEEISNPHGWTEQALRESMRTSAEIVNAIPAGFYIYQFESPDKLILLSGNPEAQRLTGLDIEKWQGREFNEIWPKAATRGITESYLKVVRTGIPFETEDLHYEDERLSGAFRIRAFALPNQRLAVAFENITALKHAEQALRESEERYRSLVEDQIELVSRFRPDGTFAYANKGFCDFFGKGREVIGSKWHPVAHPDDLLMIQRELSRLSPENPITIIENRVFDAQGEIRWVQFSNKAIFDGNGKLIEIQSVGRDITERRKMEDALKESEALQRLLLGNIDAGVVIVDPETHLIEMVNQRGAEMIGGTEDRIVGKVCHRFICPAEQGSCPVTDLEQKVDNSDRMLVRFDGSQLPILKSVHRIQIAGKEKLIETFIDITERKVAEAEREKLQAQLLQAQKMESVGRLAGGVAHDFNNMMGVILGHVELAMEQIDPGQPLFADLMEVRKAAERSADLTRQLLAFARKQTAAPKVLDLNKTVEGMLKMLRRLIGEDIELVWAPGEKVGMVKIDPSQIDQILANLCVNARDAIAGVGKVTIETGAVQFDEAYCADNAGVLPGDYTLLAVGDDGCGMDKATLAGIFEPFFTTKEVGKGTGLGLATVYGIVKQNHGFINVCSEPGMGAVFTIYLPRHMDKAEQLRKASQAEPAVKGRETILLVEDEPAILKMTTTMLERQGYRVLAAPTPGESLRMADVCNGLIDLLMTDVFMPGMNGRSLAKNLLALYPRLKLLFMSGYTADVIAHHGVLDPGVHFIQKPFTAKEITAKIREVLDSD